MCLSVCLCLCPQGTQFVHCITPVIPWHASTLAQNTCLPATVFHCSRNPSGRHASPRSSSSRAVSLPPCLRRRRTCCWPNAPSTTAACLRPKSGSRLTSGTTTPQAGSSTTGSWRYALSRHQRLRVPPSFPIPPQDPSFLYCLLLAPHPFVCAACRLFVLPTPPFNVKRLWVLEKRYINLIY